MATSLGFVSTSWNNAGIYDSIATLSVSGILNIRLLLPFGNGSGILLSMFDKETQSSSGGFGHL
jgi:hypothetical protein